MRKYLAAFAACGVLATVPAVANAETIFFHQEGFGTSFIKTIALPGAGKYNIEIVTENQSTSYIMASMRAEYDYWHGTPENPGTMTIFGNELWMYDQGGINGKLGSYLQFEVFPSYTQVVTSFPGISESGPGPYFMLMEYRNPTTYVSFHSSSPGAYSITISSAPEPGTWALMIMGFGAVGAAARQRRRTVA